MGLVPGSVVLGDLRGVDADEPDGLLPVGHHDAESVAVLPGEDGSLQRGCRYRAREDGGERYGSQHRTGVRLPQPAAVCCCTAGMLSWGVPGPGPGRAVYPQGVRQEYPVPRALSQTTTRAPLAGRALTLCRYAVKLCSGGDGHGSEDHGLCR